MEQGPKPATSIAKTNDALANINLLDAKEKLLGALAAHNAETEKANRRFVIYILKQRFMVFDAQTFFGLLVFSWNTHEESSYSSFKKVADKASDKKFLEQMRYRTVNTDQRDTRKFMYARLQQLKKATPQKSHKELATDFGANYFQNHYHNQFLEEQIEDCASNLDLIDRHSASPQCSLMTLAANAGRGGLVKDLLDLKDDPLAVDSAGESAVTVACKNNDPTIITIIDHYQDSFKCKLKVASKAIEFAKKIGNDKFARWITEYQASLVEKTTEQMTRPFASTKDHDVNIRAILSLRYQPLDPDRFVSLLLCAVFLQQQKLQERLINLHKNSGISDSQWEHKVIQIQNLKSSPLDVEIYMLLQQLKRGHRKYSFDWAESIQINDAKQRLLHRLKLCTINLSNLEKLSAHPDRTALTHAVMQHDHSLTEVLLQMGANVNRSDASGRRPLHEAIKNRAKGCQDILTRYGAAWTKTDGSGKTANELAAAV